jgi:hypothetical protein
MYASECSIHRLAELQAPDTGRREADGGGSNHDVGRYHSLNLIFGTATVTRSHNALESWC